MSNDGSPQTSPPRPHGLIGYAGGAFDLFHVGHLNILRHAKSRCDYLIAGVVSDDMLELTKGSRPVVPLSERLEIVQHVDYVDEAIAETDEDKLTTWQKHPFDIYFKGDDWKGTERGFRLERAFAEVGVEVVYFPYTVATSSTVLRRALKALSPRELSGSELRESREG
jgi:glycerol-3-phosphate cytidylyltransferase